MESVTRAQAEAMISDLCELGITVGGLKQKVESLESENAYLRGLVDRLTGDETPPVWSLPEKERAV